MLGSDAHHPGTHDTGNTTAPRFTGSHYTWVKMGRPSLDGLRLALLDGDLSLKRSDVTTDAPNQHPAQVLEQITVTKAALMGNRRPFTLQLNPWLNTLIGGRGSGKSTLVEFLRLVMRRDSEVPDALREGVAKYAKVRSSRGDDGLLRPETVLEVVYRDDNSRFRLRWNDAGDAVAMAEQQPDGGWKAMVGELAQLFPVRIYSQKQIFELARSPRALLHIIDEASEVDRRSWQRAWRQEEQRFFSLRASAREIEAGLADEAGLIGELAATERKLKVYETADHVAVLRDCQVRQRQGRDLARLRPRWMGSSTG